MSLKTNYNYQGEDSVQYKTILGNLTSVFYYLGEFEKEKREYLKRFKIYRKHYGEDNMKYLTA